MMKLKTIRKPFPVLAALLAFAASLPAQTLARPGWVGSGLTAQTWFKHAIFYEIDTRTFARGHGEAQSDTPQAGGDLKGIAEHLDYIHSLGVDALLLDPVGPAQAAENPGGEFKPIEPALGTLDDFDELVLQASRLKIRVLITLPVPEVEVARFWLTRGVAGFYIPGAAGASGAALQGIRKLLPEYVGQRVLIVDAAPEAESKSPANELVLDRGLLNREGQAVVPELRAALDESQTLLRGATPVLATASGVMVEASVARTALAAVLLNRSASLIVAGQELGVPSAGRASLMPWGQAAPPVVEAEVGPEKPTPPPVTAVPDKYQAYVPYVRPSAPKKPAPPDPATVAGQEVLAGSLLQFYRQLSVLHHGNTALHDGEEITLNHDSQGVLVWVRKPQQQSQFNAPIVIACNTRAEPIVLSLRPEMSRLQLHGSFLRTLLRSDDAMGGTSIDWLTVPAYGVFVGELRN